MRFSPSILPRNLYNSLERIKEACDYHHNKIDRRFGRREAELLVMFAYGAEDRGFKLPFGQSAT